MKFKFRYILIFFLFIKINSLFSYEIIRDPIFEEYFTNINKDFNFKDIDVYLVRNNSANAFVIENNIYFTTGLLEILEYEDTLKAIYLHEYGHVLKNHFQSKKIKIEQTSHTSVFFNLLSMGLAVFAGNTNLGIGSSITLNSNLVNEISKHSVNFEIEADNFMINEIKKKKISTSELIHFLSQVSETDNNYFRTHPKNEERINSLKKLKYQRIENSSKFEWLKSKYSNKSSNNTFNIFFKNLERGIFDQKKKINDIDEKILQYEAFKKGFFINDWDNSFHDLLVINKNSFLKIEYINYLLDNNLVDKYHTIEEFKFNKKLMNEYFYYYIYGKYYNKINKINLSNFYFCQFFKTINSINKADFFCKKYDIKDIPTLDKSYAIFK